jgi:hypothetical protein
MRSFLLASAWIAAACAASPPPAACRDIPAGGCPEDNGADPCADAACAAVYACRGGTWAFERSCPGTLADAQAAPDAEPLDAAAAADVNLDAPAGAYGGPGCLDLEAPDCSLGTALACGAALDCCGCVDLYVCDQGGWNLWGQCVDGGITGLAGH